MQQLELKVPPLAVAIIFGAGMWLIDWLIHSAQIKHPALLLAAGALFACAVVVTLAGVVAFRRAKTTVDPTRPEASTAVVTTGIYRFTRNPMYLGFLLALLGWGVFLGNIVAMAIPLVFIAYLNAFQIVPEERALRAKFGERYEAYLGQVRRWI